MINRIDDRQPKSRREAGARAAGKCECACVPQDRNLSTYTSDQYPSGGASCR